MQTRFGRAARSVAGVGAGAGAHRCCGVRAACAGDGFVGAGTETPPLQRRLHFPPRLSDATSKPAPMKKKIKGSIGLGNKRRNNRVHAPAVRRPLLCAGGTRAQRRHTVTTHCDDTASARRWREADGSRQRTRRAQQSCACACACACARARARVRVCSLRHAMCHTYFAVVGQG